MEEKKSHHVIDGNPITLAAHLRAWRSSTGFSVEDIAVELNIRPQFIRALEDGDYGIFPARVYAIGYLRMLVDHFKIPDSSIWGEILSIEWDTLRGTESVSPRLLPASQREIWYVTPRRLFMLGGTTILLFFVWLLVTQVIGFTSNPALRIDEPRSAYVMVTPIVRIKGVTEKESQLTVNGREITMNGDGVFDQEIELPIGVNALHFLVMSRFGKSSEETRYVVVK